MEVYYCMVLVFFFLASLQGMWDRSHFHGLEDKALSYSSFSTIYKMGEKKGLGIRIKYQTVEHSDYRVVAQQKLKFTISHWNENCVEITEL